MEDEIDYRITGHQRASQYFNEEVWSINDLFCSHFCYLIYLVFAKKIYHVDLLHNIFNNIVIMKYKFLFSYLLVFLSSFVTTSHAGDFADTLSALKVEADANANYFLTLHDVSASKPHSSLAAILEMGPAAWEKRAKNFSQEARQSYYFWAAVRDLVDLIEKQLKKLPQKQSESLYKLESMQTAIEFLLIQLNRAGVIAFNDLKYNISIADADEFKPVQMAAFDKVLVNVGSLHTYMCRRPDSHPHFMVDMDAWSIDFALGMANTNIYRTFFMDFKALFNAYHLLKKFHLSHYIPQQITTPFPQDQLKWVDIIAQADVPGLPGLYGQKTIKPLKGSLKTIHVYHLIEDSTLLNQLIQMVGMKLVPSVDAEVEKFRKEKRNAKKRLARAKKAEKLEAALGEEPVGQIKTLEVLNEKSETPTCVSLSSIDPAPVVAEDTDEVPAMSYTQWVEFQRKLSLLKREQATTLEGKESPEAPNAARKIMLTGGGAQLFATAMGQGAFQVKNADLQDFLRQVGGEFIKCTGPRSDIKIALPNFSGNGKPFLIRKMHLMHSGRETFPLPRLRLFMKRMIEEAKLDKAVELGPLQ